MNLAPAFVGLDERPRIYVEARLKGQSVTAASRAAGVAIGSLENDPLVVAAVQRGREICARETGITRKRIEEMLLEAYNCATTSIEMVAAARELGKLYGLYEATKLEVKHELQQVKQEHELRKLSVEDLERLVSEQGGNVLEGEFSEVSSQVPAGAD